MNLVRLSCLLVLLALGGSCKKPLEVVEAGEPPLPPEGCRIVKETYWLPNVMGNGRTETIQAEGKQYTVKQFTITRYLYNEKGQIIGVKLGNNENYNTTYEYKADSIIKIQMLIVDGKGPFPVKTIIRLNADGLDASKQYDAEGYPVGPPIPGQTTIREDGNIVTRTSSFEQIDYEHNLIRPNLPNLYPFFGKIDKNLVEKHIQTVFQGAGSLYSPGVVRRVNYYYQYDRLGRVKRLIRVGKNDKDNPGWPFGLELEVLDYEYECP